VSKNQDECIARVAKRADQIGCGWSTQGGGMPSSEEVRDELKKLIDKQAPLDTIAAYALFGFINEEWARKNQEGK
jgi:hypothetical protein